MTFVPIDSHVRREVIEDLENNFLIEAGAGSGKTTLMVDRVVALIRGGKATIDQIVVITFTEKAAAELASRLREKLEAQDQTPAITAALDGIHRAHIQTIHAFTSSLLKERPVEAGLDPGFAVLDDLEATLGFDKAYRRWLRDSVAKPPAGLELALRRGVRLKDLKDLAMALHKERALLPLAVDDPPVADVADFMAQLDDACAEARELERTALRNPDDNGWQRHLAIRLLHERLSGAQDDDARERIILRSFIAAGGGAAANWATRDAHNRQKAIVNDIKARLEALQAALRAEAVIALVPVVAEFVHDFARERKRASRAEFDDLLIWTRDLLRDNLEVRRYFQNRFRCLLVDEFQDTDPLQVEIVLLLTSDGDTGNVPLDLAPAPGKLFVVGDPKQSIYRFRRADIAIFHEVKTRVMAGRVRNIVQNFRSLPGVIAWVNRVFGQVLQGEASVQAEYVALEAVPHDHLAGPNVAIVPFTAASREPTRKPSARDWRRAEARAAARALQQARGSWPVRDERTGDLRPADYRDMVILLPTRTGIEHFEEALGDEGVPFRHESGRAFFSRQEVRDLLACLRAVDDPQDRINTVAALRSSAFGCSDEALLRYVQDGGAWDAPFPDTLVGRSLTRLAAIRAHRSTLSLPGIVERVLEETRLVEFALTTLGSVQAAANLRKVVDTARTFEAAHGGGLRAFIQWIAESETARADEADAQVAEHGEDVVRILTIHTSKGLEFPIVLVANLSSANNKKPAVIVDNRARKVDAKLGPQTAGRQTPGYEASIALEEARESAEHARLLYVAATRAADHLIVTARNDGQPSGYLSHLADHILAGDPPGEGYDDQYVPDLDGRPATGDGTSPRSHRSDDDLAAALDARTRWLEDRRALLAGTDRPREAAAGPLETAFRAALARVGLPSGTNLDQAIADAAEHYPAQAGDLRPLLESCLAHPATERARQAHRLVVRPTLTTPDGSPLEVDLLFVEDGAVVAVAYHLEPPDDTAAISEAAARLTGLPVGEVVVVSPVPATA